MVRSQVIIVLKTLIFLCCFCNHITSDDSRDLYNNRIEHNLSLRCSVTKNATTSFLNNLNLLLSDFTLKTSQNSFYNTSIGNSPDTVYGYYMCRGDITQQLCSNCIHNATEFATKSSCKYDNGNFHSEKCIFGYSNHSMYALLDKQSAFAYDYVESNVSNYQQFSQKLLSTITAVINEAAFESSRNGVGSIPGFATKEDNVTGDETIYSMAQCTPDIVGVNCSKCLVSAFSALRRSADGAPGAVVFMEKCHLRYDNVSFYDLEEFRSNKGKGLRPNLIGIYSAVLLFMGYSYLVLP